MGSPGQGTTLGWGLGLGGPEVLGEWGRAALCLRDLWQVVTLRVPRAGAMDRFIPASLWCQRVPDVSVGDHLHPEQNMKPGLACR